MTRIFKVGDWVKIDCPYDLRFHNKIAKIVELPGTSYEGYRLAADWMSGHVRADHEYLLPHNSTFIKERLGIK